MLGRLGDVLYWLSGIAVVILAVGAWLVLRGDLGGRPGGLVGAGRDIHWLRARGLADWARLPLCTQREMIRAVAGRGRRGGADFR
jgi:hypothetical protein